MNPEERFDRILDSFAWVEYFRGSAGGRIVAEELEAATVGTPLLVVAELRDKYVRERVPDWPRDLAFIKEATALIPEDEAIAFRADETKNRMRSEGRRDFGLLDAIIYETARAVGAVLVTGDPHFRGAGGVRFLE
jgi:predicted nucleic acid-binding protein